MKRQIVALILKAAAVLLGGAALITFCRCQKIYSVSDLYIYLQYNFRVSAFDAKVNFWGKVVDQDGQPVEGAQVKASVTTLRMVKTENGYREFELLNATSKGDGTFMFDGAEGFSLTIENLAKAGYVLPSAYQAGTRWESDGKYFYRYKTIGDVQAVFRPNPEAPVVFHLWKLSNPEPLMISGDVSNTNGPSFVVDAPAKSYSMAWSPGVDTDAMGLGRDIKVEVRKAGTIESPEWEVIVTAIEPDGGLVRAVPEDVFLFHAPDSGYEHSIKFIYGPEDTDEMNGDRGASLRFYVRSKSGRWYSAVDFTFFAPNQDAKVNTKMRHWLNPNGSRNLEHDAAHPLPEPKLSKR